MLRAILAVGACLVYATLRYNVFKGVAWSWWPTYVTGKAFGLGALVLIVWLLVRRLRHLPHKDDLPGWTTACMLAHVLVSLSIMTARYYPKYFAGDQFTFWANLSWLLGAVATGLLFLRLRKCEVLSDDRVLGVIGLIVGVHAAVLGFAGWFAPWTWPGYMVPITLISFLLGVVALVLGVVRVR